MLALCEVAPVQQVDDLAQTLFSMFDAKDLAPRLLKSLIEREVLRTESAATLFRRNSVATKLLTIFGKIHGSEYLKMTLQPLLQELVDRRDQLSFEVDPVKLQDPLRLQSNMRNLTTVTQAFIDAIISSVPRLPRYVSVNLIKVF